MLNKLLKRCMPWMDKGRWYHIGVTCDLGNDGLSLEDLRYDDRMFSDYDFDASGTLSIHFSDPSINATIIDHKATAHMTIPGLTSYVALSDAIAVDIDSDDSGYFLKLYPGPGTLDYWFFIKTN